MNLPSRRKSNTKALLTASPVARSSAFTATTSYLETGSTPATTAGPAAPAPSTLWDPTGFTGRMVGFLPPPTLLRQQWLPRQCPACGCNAGLKLGISKRGAGKTPQRSFSCRCGNILFEDDAGPVDVRFDASLAPSRCPRCKHSVSPRTDEQLWLWTDPDTARCSRCHWLFQGRERCRCPHCLKEFRQSLANEKGRRKS